MSRLVLLILACILLLAGIGAAIKLNYSQPSHPRVSLPHIERKGIVTKVVDGDTLVVGDNRVRLVGINTPELYPKPEPNALEAKQFIENLCPPGKEVGLDIDDLEPKDKYGRILAIVYVNVEGSWINLNAELLRRGYAEVLYFPPSEFNPYDWLTD